MYRIFPRFGIIKEAVGQWRREFGGNYDCAIERKREKRSRKRKKEINGVLDEVIGRGSALGP